MVLSTGLGTARPTVAVTARSSAAPGNVAGPMKMLLGVLVASIRMGLPLVPMLLALFKVSVPVVAMSDVVVRLVLLATMPPVPAVRLTLPPWPLRDETVVVLSSRVI